MNTNIFNNSLENSVAIEVKNNLNDFYYSHKEECEEKYLLATDKDNLDIYEEIIDQSIIDSLMLKSSIVVLTANVFEKNILHLNAVKEKQQRIVHCIINSSNNPQRPLNVNIYFFDIGDFHVLHMEAKQTGSYSMGGSADLIRFVKENEYCFPSAVISYGICFGNKYREQKIGDTIIANKLYPYFMSAKVKEQYFFVKDSNIFDIDPNLDTKLQYLMGRGRLSEKNNIFYGNMITGEAVISNELMKDIFIKAATNQPVLGGEMEGYGLFKECQGFECSIPCLLIKSICDWGAYKNIDDEENIVDNLKDKLQAYAANQAYNVLSILMQKDAGIFDCSIYDQTKNLISTLERGKVIHENLLQDILNADIKTYKKYKNLDFLCSKILDELKNEKIIEDNIETTTVHRLKERK